MCIKRRSRMTRVLLQLGVDHVLDVVGLGVKRVLVVALEVLVTAL